MPKEPMEKVSLRVPRLLWQAAHKRADERGETVSEAVRKFLERYTECSDWASEVNRDSLRDVRARLAAAARHPGAGVGDCGATDPRNSDYWCVEPVGHAGDHNRYRLDDDDWAWRRRWDRAKESQ